MGCHARPMEISEWWPRLDAKTQRWLIENNGDVVAPEVMKKINQAGGETAPEAPPMPATRGGAG